MKATKGTVGIESHHNRLRLRLPRTVTTGSSRYISLELPDTPDNRKKAQVIAWAIESDIQGGVLKPLGSYLVKPPTLPQVTSLVELWDIYKDFKQAQVEQTTFLKDYQRYSKHIQQLPTQDPYQASRIRKYLLDHHSPYTAKRVLLYLNACCNHAVSCQLLPDNPFDGMVSSIRLPLRSWDSIDPFSRAEREAIITAFYQHPRLSHYAPFVKFLFLTGCRTGEAIALQWQNVNLQRRVVIFAQSYDSSLGIRKGTKTGRVRQFPCNDLLAQLLHSVKPPRVTGETLVFPSPTGKPIINTKFTQQVWKGWGKYPGVLPGLIRDGLVSHYRPVYNTRHTFITLALESGLTVPQVARLVGNSPKVILDHYAANSIDSSLCQLLV